MKPKRQRVHYARKRLHKEDPDRYCRRNPYVLVHEVQAPITAFLRDRLRSDEVTLAAQCRHCGLRVESSWGPGMRPAWEDMVWRVEHFIIEELPY